MRQKKAHAHVQEGAVRSAWSPKGAPCRRSTQPRATAPGRLAQKLARNFHARYVWTDVISREHVVTWFPSARQVLGNGNFFVFEIPEGDRTAVRSQNPSATRSRSFRPCVPMLETPDTWQGDHLCRRRETWLR